MSNQLIVANEQHEKVQSYFDSLYIPISYEIQQSLISQGDELYGELYYYSFVKLLKYLNLTENDHFLDVGSGLGKIIFQIYLTTKVAAVSGIEIHPRRYEITHRIKEKILHHYPENETKKALNIIHGDFLESEFHDVTVVYTCSTAFSYELLNAIAEKINTLPKVRMVVSMRKLPNLNSFNLSKKIFLHGDWDSTPCYIYIKV